MLLRRRLVRSLTLTLFCLLISSCTSDDSSQSGATSAVDDTLQSDDQATLEMPVRARHEVRPSPNAATSQTIGTTEMHITFGRPGVKGRDVFGGLEPYGSVWRAGANEATVFRTTRDVTINGDALPAGVYSFFAIPEPDEWTLIFNRRANQWGAFDYNEETDALRVTATPETGPHKEWLDYSFENLTDSSATAVLQWATTRVPFTIRTR